LCVSPRKALYALLTPWRSLRSVQRNAFFPTFKRKKAKAQEWRGTRPVRKVLRRGCHRASGRSAVAAQTLQPRRNPRHEKGLLFFAFFSSEKVGHTGERKEGNPRCHARRIAKGSHHMPWTDEEIREYEQWLEEQGFTPEAEAREAAHYAEKLQPWERAAWEAEADLTLTPLELLRAAEIVGTITRKVAQKIVAERKVA
jgi:hypothetical protein